MVFYLTTSDPLLFQDLKQDCLQGYLLGILMVELNVNCIFRMLLKLYPSLVFDTGEFVQGMLFSVVKRAFPEYCE